MINRVSPEPVPVTRAKLALFRTVSAVGIADAVIASKCGSCDEHCGALGRGGGSSLASWNWLRPQGGDWRGDDAVTDREDVRAGMQDDSGGEGVAGLVAEPGQVARVGRGDGGGGHDLDGDQLPARGLDEQVYFPASLLIAQVVQPRVVAAGSEFGAQLGGDEGVQEAAEHIGAVQDGVPAEPENGRDKRRIEQVALRCLD